MFIAPRGHPEVDHRGTQDDAGWSLTELMIAMGIFAVVISVMMTAVATWSDSAVRVNRGADQAMEARKVFDSFDRTILAAAEVNRPVKVGNDWYVEMLDKTRATDRCKQWVFRGATGAVQSRDWATGTAISAPAWVTLGTRFVDEPGYKPFVVSQPSSTSEYQMLTLRLKGNSGTDSPDTLTSATFVARNSSATSDTVPDSSPSDGVSDAQVCLSDFSGARS